MKSEEVLGKLAGEAKITQTGKFKRGWFRRSLYYFDVYTEINGHRYYSRDVIKEPMKPDRVLPDLMERGLSIALDKYNVERSRPSKGQLDRTGTAPLGAPYSSAVKWEAGNAS